jgi:hypothetical protein
MRALSLRNVCKGVGGAIYQTTVPQELFPMPLAVIGGSVLTRIKSSIESLHFRPEMNSRDRFGGFRYMDGFGVLLS